MSVRMRHVSIMQYVSILRGTTAVSASQDSPEMDTTTVLVCFEIALTLFLAST